jgi:hypothetical protein
MTPRNYFDEIWQRCELLAAIHSYISHHATGALQPDELLRAEWASRVSALDLYVHELVAQNLLAIFEGTRKICPGFARLQISSDAMIRIKDAPTVAQRSTAFDLEVRTKLSRITYQYPDDIADGIRMISPCKLWNEVALKLGADQQSVTQVTELVKKRLSLIVDRRNKIVHEGDLQPTVPRTPWPISRQDVTEVTGYISQIVSALDGVV